MGSSSTGSPSDRRAIPEPMSGSTLVFGWGNPSRGDDALGPLFVEHLEALAPTHPVWGRMLFQTDFQLQVEHALDLLGHSRILFVDASSAGPAPFSLTPLHPAKDASFTTHAMTPQAVMHTYVEMQDEMPPPAWLLGIRGERFELGEDLSSAARQHLSDALRWAEDWLGVAVSGSGAMAGFGP